MLSEIQYQKTFSDTIYSKEGGYFYKVLLIFRFSHFGVLNLAMFKFCNEMLPWITLASIGAWIVGKIIFGISSST